MKKTRLCYLCGKPGADTKDHIPPKGVFPKYPSGQLITVPAHGKCNNQFSKDDEWIRNFIIAVSWKSSKAKEAWKQQVRPSWEKNPGAKKAFQQRLIHIGVKDPLSGTITKQMGVKIEKAIMNSQIARWTRGLFYHRFKKPIPVNIKVSVEKLTPEAFVSLIKVGICPKWITVEPGVFKYTYIVANDNKHIGFAIFMFFDTEIYLGSTGII